MYRLPFNAKRRGQMSLLALVMTTMLLFLAMTHYQRVMLALKSEQAYARFPFKAEALRNAVHEARLSGTEDGGALTYRNRPFAYQWLRDAGTRLQTDLISARFQEFPHWPRVLGFWVQNQNLNLYLKHYQED